MSTVKLNSISVQNAFSLRPILKRLYLRAMIESCVPFAVRQSYEAWDFP